MSERFRFDDKVVVVTGAGNGLGRSHALAFASRGAKVLVNDLGGDTHGEGSGSAPADKVVAEIKEAGGEAAANYDSVVEGARIIESAMDHFGRVDVVINNAGILRDVSFHKMTEQDWDLVYQVHVKGAFAVTHAVWPHLREQEYGRVLFTASAAGLYGNFGQANYAMAKLGLVGLTNTLAVEGRKRNIHVNAIAPVAGSRMTETIMPPELVEKLKPEYVSPLVLFLCHEDTDLTGGVFEVGGGWIGRVRLERSKGQAYKLSAELTPEKIADRWEKINDFTGATHPNEVNAALAPVLENLNSTESKGGNEFIDVDEALGYEFPPVDGEYTEKDAALYALGIGAAADPLNEQDLRLVYENHGQGFQAFPTFAVTPALKAMFANPQAPGLNFGFDRILHGEQELEIHRPLPSHAKLTSQARIAEIWDKGKNALVVNEIVSSDDAGPLFTNRVTTVVRGAGGWGGERGPSAQPNTPPDRDPDASVEQTINANQALLYRLSGDINPLHADPNMASAVGFERPILHGLCTFGYAARHVLNTFAEGHPEKLKRIQVRFADVVFPGETLVTEMWKESENRILFRCRIKERDTVVIKHAAVELFDEVPERASAPKAGTQSKSGGASAPAGSAAAQIFEAITGYVGAHPELVGEVGKVFQFAFSDPDSQWFIDLKNGSGSVGQGASDAPDVTLRMTDADFAGLATGQENAQALYLGGKLKIEGDLMAAQKLTFLQKVQSESGGGEQAPSRAGELVGKIADKLSGGVFQFVIHEPDAQWYVDGEATEGSAKKADVTLELSEADLAALIDGSVSAQSLFQKGRLKVRGDMTLAQKVGASL